MLLFSDESGFCLHPKLGRVWAKKGTQPFVVTKSQHHKRLNVFGWVDPVKGRHGMIKRPKGNADGFLDRHISPDAEIKVLKDTDSLQHAYNSIFDINSIKNKPDKNGPHSSSKSAQLHEHRIKWLKSLNVRKEILRAVYIPENSLLLQA